MCTTEDKFWVNFQFPGITASALRCLQRKRPLTLTCLNVPLRSKHDTGQYSRGRLEVSDFRDAAALISWKTCYNTEVISHGVKVHQRLPVWRRGESNWIYAKSVNKNKRFRVHLFKFADVGASRPLPKRAVLFGYFRLKMLSSLRLKLCKIWPFRSDTLATLHKFKLTYNSSETWQRWKC